MNAYRPEHDRLLKEIATLRSNLTLAEKLLEEIKGHEHCNWHKEPQDYETGAILFDAGHTEGHRCCSKIAERYWKEKGGEG